MIAKKCLGQNYLHNPHILSKIILALSLNPDDIILEVGPGPSLLTKKMLPLVNEYFAVEIDEQFKPILLALEKEFSNFHFKMKDFLKISLDEYIKCNKFVGNLPYNISSPILYRLATETNIHTLVCMFAIGSAERYLAKPGFKNYSASSILAQSFFLVEKIALVPKTQFYPQPDIDSMILKFSRKKENQLELISFNEWIQPLFSYRRKMIANSLEQTGISEEKVKCILLISEIKETERIENIPLEKLRNLFEVYKKEVSL